MTNYTDLTQFNSTQVSRVPKSSSSPQVSSLMATSRRRRFPSHSDDTGSSQSEQQFQPSIKIFSQRSHLLSQPIVITPEHIVRIAKFLQGSCRLSRHVIRRVLRIAQSIQSRRDLKRERETETDRTRVRCCTTSYETPYI